MGCPAVWETLRTVHSEIRLKRQMRRKNRVLEVGQTGRERERESGVRLKKTRPPDWTQDTGWRDRPGSQFSGRLKDILRRG